MATEHTTQSNSLLRVGVYDDPARAEAAIKALSEAGYPPNRISYISAENSDKISAVSQASEDDPAGEHAAESAIIGGSVGALLGGIVAAAGFAASGGLGLVVVGPMILGASGTGAVTGGFIGAMMSRGFDSEVADYYDQALRDHKTLVAVDTTGGENIPKPSRAEQILAFHGAEPLKLPRD